MPDDSTHLHAGRRADIIRRRLAGESLREIAAVHGITYGAVWQHLQTEEAKHILNEVRASIVPALVEDIQNRAPEVIDTLIQIALGRTEAKPNQVQAAMGALKLAGMEERIVNVVEGGLDVTARVADLTPDELDAEIAKLERGSDRPAE